MRLGMTTLIVRDYDEAIAWFTKTLGFALTEDTPLSADKRWVTVAAPDGGALLLAKASKPEQTARIGDQTGGRVGYFLYTAQFRPTYERLMRAGVDFVETPRKEDYGQVVVFRDLYGNKWDLVERA